jgi:hypothetical protein
MNDDTMKWVWLIGGTLILIFAVVFVTFLAFGIGGSEGTGTG